MNTSESIARLTDREKECLRLWLEHKTAKEIARELGVSHHAIEKRLKMARTKLGVSTSLEAARLLTKTEKYQQTGAQSPEVPRKASNDHHSLHALQKAAGKRRKMIMLTLSIALAMTVATSQHSAPVEGPAPEAALETQLSNEAKAARITFDRLDRDNSNFIEEEEFISPLSSMIIDQVKSGLVIDKEKADRQISGVINFEADSVSVIPYDEDATSDKVVVTLDYEDTRKRRQIMFGLIDRDQDNRIDQSELMMAQIEGFGTRTFTVQSVPPQN